MPTLAHNAAPPVAAINSKRRWRNYLLDVRFQLKLAGYAIGVTLVLAGLLGAFLWRTTQALLRETEVAVEARSRAAESSKDLSSALLANEILQNRDDPKFEAQVRERSAAIDRAHEGERLAIIEARAQLVHRQKLTLIALVGGFLAFVAIVGLGTIITTHKIVGPLFRVKRMAQEVAAGTLREPAHGLRSGDELKDVFEAFFAMVKSLRERQEADLQRAKAALELAARTGAQPELLRELEALQTGLEARLR